MTEHAGKGSQPTLTLKPIFPKDHSVTALQGASFAALPKAPTPTTSLSPASAGARTAALVAGLNSAQHSPRDAFARTPSPVRGRSPVQNSFPSGFMTLSISPVTVSRSKESAQHCASTIAAKYASSQSASPLRSPNRSPLRGQNVGSSTEGREQTDIAKALSGALASIAKSRGDGSGTEETTPVQNRNLDFGRLPSLSPAPAQQLSRGLESDKQTSKQAAQAAVPSSAIAVPQRPTSSGRRSRSLSLHSVPTNISEMSFESSSMISDTSSSDDPSVEPPASASAPAPMLSTLLKHRPHLPHHRSFFHRKHHHQTSQPTANELRELEISRMADAMVASSLASSRAASPTKAIPPAHPLRRPRSFSALHDLAVTDAPTQSSKQLRPHHHLRHTLRKSQSDDEEDEPVKRGRRHFMRKHPHMHHEGDRKRWRDKVTERERKRYEGVFAANRGLYVGAGSFDTSPTVLANASSEYNRVANVVVREIWERSRLPLEILQEIYDLVSPLEEQSLNREQFVVGLWLVDQRLKGRKLPVKISTSIWSSVRDSAAIKMKNRT